MLFPRSSATINMEEMMKALDYKIQQQAFKEKKAGHSVLIPSKTYPKQKEI